MGESSKKATLHMVIPLGMLTVPRNGPESWKAQEVVIYLTGEMTAVDGQPLSLMEDVAFRWLPQYMAPWYYVPSQRTMS